MNKLKQVSVGRQVLFTFGTLCAVLLIIGGLFFFSLRSVEHSNQVQLRAMNELALIDDTAQDVGQMQAEILTEVLASDRKEINHLDQDVRDIEQTNAKELADYQKFVDTEKERQLYKRVMQAQNLYWEHTQPVLMFSRDNRDAEAIKFINSQQAPAYDEYLKAINGLINYVEADVDETAGTTTHFISEIRIIGDVLISVAILIAIGTGFAMIGVTRRLKGDNNLLQTEIAERKRVEGHLFQSQKMETVGKLAGGIAHEFNSIMTAIIGQSELLLTDLPPGNPLARNAAEIRQAADRAATLTRQLLAYGRKQILQPETLDLNAVIVGMENTLQHLMGRNVEVRFSFAAGIKSVKADAGQIEQVIVNIAMNAAEAMPNGGKLTLETVNVTLDADYVSRFPELKAGEYVMLAIGDTGAGMSNEVKARAFEPFFTTKGVGQGTGLGLATCHGIIKQSGGHIAVYSEPGRGTTFKIYLPQIESEMKSPTQPKTSSELSRGTETILLVEDDPSLREMAGALLERLGYTVLAAANGVEAMGLIHRRDRGHIDLLFTDVVMPHMSGKELADRVHALHPQTKILFTSAYTENAIVHQGVLNPGVALLQKPFTPRALAHKLREVLD